MKSLIVLENPKDWPLDVPAAEVVSARAYLMEPRFTQLRGARVFNMCTDYSYQSLGYYVSLVAQARGHKPMPAIATIQDLKSSPLVRVVTEELDTLVNKALAPLRSGRFTLSIYFGGNLAKRYDRLCLALFNQFPAPFLRASFRYDADDQTWGLESIRPIAADEIPEEHLPFVLERAASYFERPRTVRARRREWRYDLAILYEDSEATVPSNEQAIRKFVRAAESMEMAAEVITKDDGYARLGEFDALFIRETTAVNHHTFRFARRASAEGLVVIDDPESILRCTNKVYLAELLERHGIATPRTAVIDRESTGSIALAIGYPCILKQPDSSFSQGVVKVNHEGEFLSQAERLFKTSDLLLVQEFCPTSFDWRIGVLGSEPLFACKYHMAEKHWQIFNRRRTGEVDIGRVEAVPLDQTPAGVVRVAVRASRLVGDGFYGVDVKDLPAGPVVIEVNDNPSVDAGYEDRVLGMDLYEAVMRYFVRKIEAQRREGR